MGHEITLVMHYNMIRSHYKLLFDLNKVKKNIKPSKIDKT